MKSRNRKGLLWAALALASICALVGCQKEAPADTLPKPDFLLEEQVITDTLEQVGLGWVIDEEETQISDDRILHSLRDPEKGYPGGGPDSRLLCAGITSAMMDGERCLGLTLPPESAAGFDPSVSQPFDWADWEQHLQLAALLYGFEDENELYNAVCVEKLSEENTLRWEQQLTGGYCRVRVRPMERQNFTGDRYIVYVECYPSQDFCEELDAQVKRELQEAKERQEALKNGQK